MKKNETVFFMHGGPATGKTTIGRRLAAAFCIPYISKDGVKEPIFDSIGCPTAWEADGPLSGRKMDDASLEILFYLIDAQVQAGCGCVIDSTFQARHVSRLNAILHDCPVPVVQIHCRADTSVLLARYRRRAETGERHPGHLDQNLLEHFDGDALEQIFQPLDIAGHLVRVDTTEFAEADHDQLLESVKALIKA